MTTRLTFKYTMGFDDLRARREQFAVTDDVAALVLGLDVVLSEEIREGLPGDDIPV